MTADIRDIDQHGLECISKSTEPVKPGYINRYRLRTSGISRSQALTSKILVDQINVTDVEIFLPLSGTLDPDVNAITLTNDGETNSFYYSTQAGFRAGYLSNTSNGGKRIGPGESQNIPVTDNILLYIKCESGKSTKLEFVQWI